MLFFCLSLLYRNLLKYHLNHAVFCESGKIVYIMDQKLVIIMLTDVPALRSSSDYKVWTLLCQIDILNYDVLWEVPDFLITLTVFGAMD